MSHLAVVVPNAMAARMVFASDVLDAMAANPSLQAVFATPDPKHREVVERHPNLRWASMGSETETQDGREWRQRLHRAARRWMGAEFANLAFRFNHLHGFSAHRHKMALPEDAKRREALAGNFLHEALGRPWPSSKSLFKALYALHYADWVPEPSFVEAFFERERPERLAIVHVQNARIGSYARAARRRRIPMSGVVASWDQPTTKGPLCRGLQRIAVQNAAMQDELVAHHQVPTSRIVVTGWPQMDVYRQQDKWPGRSETLSRLSLKADESFLLFAANTERLGGHEPDVVRHLADRLTARPGKPLRVVLRPHPRDVNWQARFSHLAGLGVIVLPAQQDELNWLASLLANTEMTICTGGSIALDAMAFDKPVVSLTSNCGLGPLGREDIGIWLQADHVRRLLGMGGVRAAASLDALDDAVSAYLADPGLDAAARRMTRQTFLEPFDGRASARLAHFLMGAA